MKLFNGNILINSANLVANIADDDIFTYHRAVPKSGEVYEPIGITGAALKALFAGGGVTAFTQLSDVPNSYAGSALKVVRVNAAGTALEFYVPASDVFEADFTVSLTGGKTFGKYTTGQTVPALGKTAAEVILDAAIEYLPPAFTSFTVATINSTEESGTTISGNKTFSWVFSNPSNITPSTVDIIDSTAAVNLATNISNTSPVILPIGTITKVVTLAGSATQQWRASATNTQASEFLSSLVTVTWRNKYFYGPNASTPVDSATARALPSNAYYTGGATFTLNTGDTLTDFFVCIPSTKSITSVIDLDALNANITANYVDLGNITVNDAGGNPFTYKLYRMTVGVPYSTNHRHSVTIN